MSTPRLLAIETSCDETAAAVVDSSLHVHSSVVSSQIDLHAAFGGGVSPSANCAGSNEMAFNRGDDSNASCARSTSLTTQSTR